MSDVHRTRAPDTTAADVQRLRRLRRALDQAVRELPVWIDLLRHKSLALRAVQAEQRGDQRAPARSPASPVQQLTPGSLEPEALARALAAGVPLPRPPRRTRRPRLVGDNPNDDLDQARELWDTVADPYDAQSCRDLADAADRLADRLEDRLHEARDRLRATSDELTSALAAANADHEPDMPPAG